MTYIAVDDTLCQKDGICSLACPVSIIEWQKGEFARPMKSGEKLCISCGHCVAICPHKAISHASMGPEDCLPYSPDLVIGREQAEQFLRGRRSIRKFKTTPLDRQTVADMIHLASHAPSGHNSQPVQWQVIQGIERIHFFTALVVEWMQTMIAEKPGLSRIMGFPIMVNAWKSGRDMLTRDAPTLVLVKAPEGNPASQAACTIAMTYFDLSAQAFNAGTCWCGYFLMAAINYPPLQEALELPDKTRVFGVMMAGYPMVSYPRMPKRNAPDITWMD